MNQDVNKPPCDWKIISSSAVIDEVVVYVHYRSPKPGSLKVSLKEAQPSSQTKAIEADCNSTQKTFYFNVPGFHLELHAAIKLTDKSGKVRDKMEVTYRFASERRQLTRPQ